MFFRAHAVVPRLAASRPSEHVLLGAPHRTSASRRAALLLVLAACSIDPADSGAVGATTTGATTTTTTGTTTTAPENPTTTGATSTAGPDTGSVFIMAPDCGCTKECDIYLQDCPEGQKCAPHSADGDSSWEQVKCVDLVPTPDGLHQSCAMVGSIASGEDTCDEGLMCWGIDPDTQLGTCLALCQGSVEAPTCPDPGTACHTGGESVFHLCFPLCDPLGQDCPPGETCLPLPGDRDNFFCVLDASGDDGQLFDPCEYHDACDPGLHCTSPALALECDPMAAWGCCLPFCDLDLPDPCPGQGQQCLPWHDPGDAPPGLEDLGHCARP